MSIASHLNVDLSNKQPDRPLLYGPDGNPISSDASGPKSLHFEERAYEHFDVEVADRDDDVIYHFWPPKDGDVFIQGFAGSLEEGFKATLPASADVRAKYTNREEAAVLAKHAEFELRLDKESRTMQNAPWIPRETYFVRVVGGTHYALVDVFLKNRVFDNIEKAIKASRS